MKYFKRISLLLLIGLILSVASLLYSYFNNFYVVIPDKIYRARQLNQKQFETYIQQHRIKSVLNLRGEHWGDTWYQNEIKACKNTHATHYDLGLLSTQLPSMQDMQTLINIIDSAEKPLLIHCESGVDRTGFAAALAMILANDSNLKKINDQTSINYFVLAKNSVGKQFLRLYFDWLTKNNLSSTHENLMTFLQTGNYPHD